MHGRESFLWLLLLFSSSQCNCCAAAKQHTQWWQRPRKKLVSFRPLPREVTVGYSCCSYSAPLGFRPCLASFRRCCRPLQLLLLLLPRKGKLKKRSNRSKLPLPLLVYAYCTVELLCCVLQKQLYNSTNICCPFSFSFMAGRLFFLATAMRRHSKEWKALACAHARGMVATAHNYTVAGGGCVRVAQPVLCDFGVRLGFPKVVHHSIRGNSTPSCVAQGTQTHWPAVHNGPFWPLYFDLFTPFFLDSGFIVYLFPYIRASVT